MLHVRGSGERGFSPFLILALGYCVDYSDTTQNLFTVMGASYAAAIFLGINNAGTVQPVVAIERTVFYRERGAGMYSAIPYALAQASLVTTIDQ